jgi:hypothetical protein
MKSIALSALLAITSASSFATPELMVFNDHWASPKSRAEVRAELQAARINDDAFTGGEYSVGQRSVPARFTLARAEVRPGPLAPAAPNGEGGAAAPAASADARYALYRRVVLGDLHATAPVASTFATPQVQPGSYARYLMLNGHAAPFALDQARQIGEVASTVQPPAKARPALTPYESYRRAAEGDWRADVGATSAPPVM